MKRFAPAAATATVTLLALAVLLFSTVDALALLLITSGGAPLTMLLLAKAVADPDREGRRLWPSLLIGGTAVPALALALHGLFLALGMALVEPFADAGFDLLDKLRADPTIIDVLTDYWAFVFIAELAVVAPLAEETLKPLAAVVRRPRNGRDAFLFGAAAGTGFAIVENVLYASGWFWTFDYWLSISTVRMIGSGLHVFGAALVSWGVFRLRDRAPGRWRRFGLVYAVAFTAHAAWNGTIAVAQVLYAARSEFGPGELSADALAWGLTLQAVLVVIALLVGAGLLAAARNVAHGREPMRGELLANLERPQAIAAWAVLSVLLLIPSTVAVLVFPDLVAL